jgi:hypothetical protein
MRKRAKRGNSPAEVWRDPCILRLLEDAGNQRRRAESLIWAKNKQENDQHYPLEYTYLFLSEPEDI